VARGREHPSAPSEAQADLLCVGVIGQTAGAHHGALGNFHSMAGRERRLHREDDVAARADLFPPRRSRPGNRLEEKAFERATRRTPMTPTSLNLPGMHWALLRGGGELWSA
jgi:hypothetical protein